MAKHIHIHIHRPARTRDAVKSDPDREALVAALMEAIRARGGKTQDADFKEEEHPRDHGKFTSGGGSGPSGPKPTSATAKGSKAAVHELLSSGHRFSVDELMKATGCSNKSTLMTALADLKNPKYAGKLGALKIEKHADGGYHVVKNTDTQEIPIHPDLAAVTRPGAPIPGSGKKPTKGEGEDMARRAGEPRVGAAPKGAVRATWGQTPDKPVPQSAELPIHPDLAAVMEPGGTVPGSGKTPTKAEVGRMAARAGEPSPGASPTVIPRSGAIETKQATSKAVHDPLEGTHHVVTLPSGAVHKIQRLNSTESMGVPGFHVISDKEGWRGSVPTYMGDTKQEAIQALQEREAKKGSPAKKTHEEEAAEWRAGIAAKKAAGEIKDGGSHVVYKRTPQGTRYLAPDGRWITYTGGTQGMSASDAAELARKHPGANYRPVKHRDY